MSKRLLWCQKVCHEVKNTSWREKVKNMSWCQSVCYDVKFFGMKSKTFHDVKKFAMTSKRRHDFNKFVMMSKHIMTSNSSLWHQKVCHDVKNMLWWHKVRHCFIMTRHGVKRFAMTSKVCHEVKSCHEVKICYDVNDIQNVSWRKENTMTFVITSKSASWRPKYVMSSKPYMT